MNFWPTVYRRVYAANPVRAETNTSFQHFLSVGLGSLRSKANGKRIKAAVTVRTSATVTGSIPSTAIRVAAGVAPQRMIATEASK